ncbi:hypothetical protein JHR36_09345, partial [Campylobacter jejuni]|nr:hypothetical protein [Campylobacter jejuni]
VASAGLHRQLAGIGVLVLVAMAAYFALCLVTGGADRQMVGRLLRLKRPPRGA